MSDPAIEVRAHRRQRIDPLLGDGKEKPYSAPADGGDPGRRSKQIPGDRITTIARYLIRTFRPPDGADLERGPRRSSPGDQSLI